jgi:hypothetical protein
MARARDYGPLTTIAHRRLIGPVGLAAGRPTIMSAQYHSRFGGIYRFLGSPGARAPVLNVSKGTRAKRQESFQSMRVGHGRWRN